ncbi:MAG TPA: NAD+ synthase [Thermodesulfobacteriota bacterium]|nr:NAD+ synthase [Thermodesulfobacteriota bacterium]
MRALRIAMAQINPFVGDLSANAALILSFVKRAKALDSDLVIFPELALTGYPPEDLLLKPRFIDDNIRALKDLSKKVRGITAVVGFVDRREDIYNAAAIIHAGQVVDVYHKMYLPNYGVFDEQRYFQAGTEALNFTLNGVKVGVGICEDIWYPEGPARVQALAGAQVVVNINASPYHIGKALVREEMLVTRALDNEVIIAYNNMYGGQDELLFDGQGMVISERGVVMARGKAFEEDLIVADLNIDATFMARLHDTRRREEKLRTPIEGLREIELAVRRKKKKKKRLPPRDVRPLDVREEVFRGLVLGTRDYVKKNGFTHAVIGLSGGIDSAVVAAIAAEALGAGNITAVFMPSRYTSVESKEDAEATAKNLGIEMLTVPMDETFERYLEMLKPVFRGRKPDTTEENLQARVRGNILMALSNKFGWLVLTTGNKSEMSVGYATLYGDMAGGFAVIKDLPKTLEYEVASWINENAGSDLIPARVLTKAPTAELKADQTDQDVLPPYDVLDRILKAYVEEDKGLDEIVEMGFPARVVKKVIRMVDLSEYKRRQAPPGIKITPRALGKDRRMPITNGYRKGYSE